MSIANHSIPSPDRRQVYLEWLASSGFGRALHKLEAEYLVNHLQLTYNQTILQVGKQGLENGFVSQYFERNHIIVDSYHDTSLKGSPLVMAESGALPLAQNSVDVVLLPHVLEFDHHPHALLGEVDRVLKPDGKVFIFCFNPWRVDKFNRYISSKSGIDIPNPVGPARLLGWLGLLRLEAELLAGFHPSSDNNISVPRTIIGHSKTMLATAYLVKGVKRTYAMLPDKPILFSTKLARGAVVDTAVLGNFNETHCDGVHRRGL
jgi:SAM-dependent methyltransferase